MEEKQKPLVVDLPLSIHRRLKARAAEKGLSISAAIREMIADWLKGNK